MRATFPQVRTSSLTPICASFHPSPFFVLDEVDAALDNTNTSRVARYVTRLSGPDFQCLVISHKTNLFQEAEALIG